MRCHSVGRNIMLEEKDFDGAVTKYELWIPFDDETEFENFPNQNMVPRDGEKSLSLKHVSRPNSS